jgi:hypothetical protein
MMLHDVQPAFHRGNRRPIHRMTHPGIVRMHYQIPSSRVERLLSTGGLTHEKHGQTAHAASQSSRHQQFHDKQLRNSGAPEQKPVSDSQQSQLNDPQPARAVPDPKNAQCSPVGLTSEHTNPC